MASPAASTKPTTASTTIRYALIEPTREMMLTATSQERGGPAESGSALGAEVGGQRLPLTDSGGTSPTVRTAFPQFRGYLGKSWSGAPSRAPPAGFEPAHTAPECVSAHAFYLRKR